MEESLNDIDEQDMLPVLDVRVLDATKKSKFRVRRLINFPLAETMDEMKSALKIFMPDIEHVEKLRYRICIRKKQEIYNRDKW